MEKILKANINNKDEFIGYEAEQNTIDDETEDEEVKLNCIGGIRGCQDSDFSSHSGAAEDEDEDDLDEEMER